MGNRASETDTASKPVILLVDDQPRNLQLLGNSLLKLNYDIVFAQSGEEALVLVAEAKPDLILLDIMMPGMDGREVCRRIVAEHGEDRPAIIFVTARTEAEDIAEGLNLGAVDYITKPIQIAEVKARVKTHLELLTSRNRLRRMNRHLEKINQEQRFFISVLSHDLRSPLSGVELFLDDLLDEIRPILPEDAREGMETILGSVVSMNRLLEELLQWARYQSSRERLIVQSFEVEAAVREILPLVQSQMRAKGLRTEIGIPPNLVARCDLRIFSTVIRNLFSNAIKFSGRGGVVEVRAVPVDSAGAVRIEVEDQGVGMGAEQIQRLFDPENRGSTLGTERERGSGLGLILCQSLLGLVDSRLEVRSEIDKGTCFWFDLGKEP